MIPVLAASRTPISAIDTASPPRTRPKSRDTSRSSSAAIPERSSRSPIRTNIGSATSTQLSIRSKIRSPTSDV